MADDPTPPPTQVGLAVGPQSRTTDEIVDRGMLVAITVGAVAIAVVLGCLIGYSVGMITFMTLGEDDPDVWNLIGNALVAMAFGVAAGAATYIGVAVAAIVRWVPAGSRVWPIFAALVGVPALLLAMRALVSVV